MDHDDLLIHQHGYGSQPVEYTLDDELPAALATLVHAHLIDAGHDVSRCSMRAVFTDDEMSLEMLSRGPDGGLRQIMMPNHQLVEDRIAGRIDDGILEVSFDTDFQSTRRAGAAVIESHLESLGLTGREFSLDPTINAPTRLERLVDALAEVNAGLLPAGENRQLMLVIADEDIRLLGRTATFGGEMTRSSFEMSAAMKDAIRQMAMDPEGRTFDPIGLSTTSTQIVQATRVPLPKEVAPGADERLDRAISAPPPGGGVTRQAELLRPANGPQGIGPMPDSMTRGPVQTPRHDPFRTRDHQGR
jgi:hypothetical protein